MNEGKSVATAEEVACPGGPRQALAEIERLALRMYDEVLDSRRGRAFGRAELEGCPAVYCQHLSQGWTREWVQTSLGEVGRAIGSAERDVGNPTSPLMLSRGDESHVRRSEPRSSFVGGGTVQPFGLTLGLQI